ncbi:MAG: hypothetical protein ABFS86_12165 [Planctomycetota bacterium]
MKQPGKRVLVVVDVDPRASDRAVEALRMSVGLAAADNDVRVVLQSGAEALAGPERTSLPGGARATAFLDALERLGAHIETGEDTDRAGADVLIRWTAGETDRQILLGPDPEGCWTRVPLEGDPDGEALLDAILLNDRTVIW